MLRWHYRSRHQSLIAVSNSQFYENKLVIIPSPYTSEAAMGLQFHYLPHGVFDTGGTGVNAVEASEVALAIIRHAKIEPEFSLGVATFSVRQRRAVLDQLEILRRLHPDTEEFFHAHLGEPFFVKNLENVQGDERDVILISVGYGKNLQGVMSMRFGPLGAEGGERRLNVLISRAKRRCEVFASITDEDIDVERAHGKGILAFKHFLHYARTGQMESTGAAAYVTSEVFESQVAAALLASGYQVHPHVGIAGIFIDMAITDESCPGRYILGVDCDGASYRDARSARDRDRLHLSVLQDHGWMMHRIWSSDWFHRPCEEFTKLVQAVEAAKVALGGAGRFVPERLQAKPSEITAIERTDLDEIELTDRQQRVVAKHYRQAEGRRLFQYREIPDAPSDELAALVEGGVHAPKVMEGG